MNDEPLIPAWELVPPYFSSFRTLLLSCCSIAALAGAAVTIAAVRSGDVLDLCLILGFGVLLVAVSIFELFTGRILNVLTVPGMALAVILSLAAGAEWPSLAGALVIIAPLFVIPFATDRLGMGTAKVAAVAASLLGVPVVLAAVAFAGALLAAAYVAERLAGNEAPVIPTGFAVACGAAWSMALFGASFS